VVGCPARIAHRSFGASDAAAEGRWGERTRVTAIKKHERVASEGKFLLNHWDCISGATDLCTAPQARVLARPKAALPVMLRPKAADARDVERAVRDDRIMIRCAAEGEFLSIYFAFSPLSSNHEPRSGCSA
jgi:hypothetical protein